MNESAPAELDWKRLGTLVRTRRDELGLTQQEVQARGGPSPAAIRRLENDQAYRRNNKAYRMAPSKRRDLERALEWQLGSVDEVLRGGDPKDSAEPIVIPGIAYHATERGDVAFELRSLRPIDPMRLLGMAVASKMAADAAAEVAEGNSETSELIELTYKAFNAVTNVLADALGTTEADAQRVAESMSYVLNVDRDAM